MRYLKDENKLTIKIVKESNADIILEVPITPFDLMDYFKTNFVNSVLRNSFGEAKFKEIGDVRVFVDQLYVLTNN